MELIKNATILTLILGIVTCTTDAGENGSVADENLTDDVKAILEKYAEFMVKKDADCLAGLFTDDMISTVYGKPPTFGKESFKASYERMFEWRVYARMESTIDGLGKEDDLIYAWGQGTGYNTTKADATPLGKVKYERIFKRNKDGELRIWLQNLFRII